MLNNALKNTTILIVDDNEIDRYLLKHHLESMNVGDICELDDGAGVLDFICQKQDQSLVVFLDLEMSVVDGFEVLEQLKTLWTDNSHHNCKIIIHSSSTDHNDKRRSLAYDFVSEYLVKGSYSGQDIIQYIQFNALSA